MGLYRLCSLVCDKGDDPILVYERRIVAGIMALLVLSMFLARPPQTTAQFVIAGWGFPADDYGQGISRVVVFENSTGSYAEVPESPLLNNGPSEVTLNATVNTALYIRPYCQINHTLYGLTVIADAYLFMRISINISVAGVSLFSQQNMTVESYFTPPAPYNVTCWVVSFFVYVPLILIAGTTYLVVFNYEVYG